MKVKKYNCIKINTKTKTKEEVMKNGRNQKQIEEQIEKLKEMIQKNYSKEEIKQQKDKLDQLLKEYTKDLK